MSATLKGESSKMHSNPNRRRIRGRLWKTLLATAATFFALLASEVLVRALGQAPHVQTILLNSDECVYQRSTNAVLGFELKANFRHERPDFIQNYARTNRHGQRD